jgi:6-phosphogluconolactonase
MEFKFSNNSAITVKKFNSISELAEELVPALTSGSVAISGGSTYEALFTEWALLKPDLSTSWYCAVDERVVPMDHPESNWGAGPRKMFIACGAPEQCNNHYNTAVYLKTLLRNRFSSEPIFDTIFLGVGEDGHTASLFPSSPFVHNMTSAILKTKSPVGVEKRITLGPRVFKNAKEVIMVITGENKKVCVNWLASEFRKPFVSVLKRREHSTVYLDSDLYSYFESLQ